LNALWLSVVYAILSVVATSANRVLLSGPLLGASPRFSSLVASLTGVPVLLGACLLSGDLNSLLLPSRSTIALFALVGVLNSGVSRLLLYYAMRHIGANQAEALQTTAVLFSFALAVVFLGEILTPVVLAGGILIIAGSFLIEGRSSSRLRGGSLKAGVLSAILSSLVFAFVLVLVRSGLSSGYPPLAAAVISAVSALSFNVLIYDWRTIKKDLHALSKGAMYSVVSAGVLIAIAQAFRYIAFSFAPVILVSPIISVSPIFVVVLTRLFTPAHEVARWRTILSVCLAVAGAAVVSYVVGAGG
jgi:drug/metabolite transporter (DMT)-like permease